VRGRIECVPKKPRQRYHRHHTQFFSLCIDGERFFGREFVRLVVHARVVIRRLGILRRFRSYFINMRVVRARWLWNGHKGQLRKTGQAIVLYIRCRQRRTTRKAHHLPLSHAGPAGTSTYVEKKHTRVQARGADSLRNVPRERSTRETEITRRSEWTQFQLSFASESE
jgi:hypothetical protein